MSRLFARMAPRREKTRVGNTGMILLLVGVSALLFLFYSRPFMPGWRGADAPQSGTATLVRVVDGHHGKVSGSYTYLVRLDAGLEGTATFTDLYPIGSRMRLVYRPMSNGVLRVYQYSPCSDDCP